MLNWYELDKLENIAQEIDERITELTLMREKLKMEVRPFLDDALSNLRSARLAVGYVHEQADSPFIN